MPSKKLPAVTDDDRDRAALRYQIRQATRKADPNAARMKQASDLMEANAMIERMKKVSGEKISVSNRESRMASAAAELKDNLRKVRSKRSNVPDGTTLRGTIRVSQITEPEVDPEAFNAKSKVTGTIMPFSKDELTLVTDRLIGGTNVRRVLNPTSSWNKKEICNVAVATLKVKPDAPQDRLSKLRDTINQLVEAIEEEEGEDEKHVRVDITGEPGDQYLRIKFFTRDDDIDPFADLAREYAEDFLGDENHPAVNQSRRFFDSIDWSLEFGQDLNELFQSDDSLTSLLSNARLFTELNFPHNHRDLIIEAGLAKFFDRLKRRSNKVSSLRRGDMGKIAVTAFALASTGAVSRGEGRVVYNSLESAVASVVRSMGPRLRKKLWQEEDLDEGKLAWDTTAPEEALARILTRQYFMGISGIKLRNFLWSMLLQAPEELPAMDIVCGADELFSNLEGIQIYGPIAQTDIKITGATLDGLFPSSRADIIDLLRSVVIADQEELKEYKKSAEAGSDDDDEDDSGSDMDPKNEEDLMELVMGNELLTPNGIMTRCLGDQLQAEENVFSYVNDGNGDELTDPEKAQWIQQDLASRNATAVVSVCGSSESAADVTKELMFQWVPAARPKSERQEAVELERLDDEDQINERCHYTVVQSRKIELLSTIKKEKFFDALSFSDVAVYVFHPEEEREEPWDVDADKVKETKETILSEAKSSRKSQFIPTATKVAKNFDDVRVVLVSVGPNEPTCEEYLAVWKGTSKEENVSTLHIEDATNTENAKRLLAKVAELTAAKAGEKGLGKSNGSWDFY